MKKINPYLLVIFLFTTIFATTTCSHLNFLAKSEGEGLKTNLSSQSVKSDILLEEVKGGLNKISEEDDIKISNYEILKTCGIKSHLRYLGAPEEKIKELADAIRYASFTTEVSQELIIALIKTESNFKPKAISSKQYKGLMQTPSATFIYFDVDILHGCRIFEDKLKITNGNILRALALYKGGNNPMARRYAKQTYDLYKHLLGKRKKCEKDYYSNNIFSDNFSEKIYQD